MKFGMLSHKYRFLNLILLMVLFWGINQSLPFVMDDALYAHIYPAVSHCKSNPHGLDVDETITSVSDIFVSQYHHYFNNNGRSVVHFIVQVFCGLLGKRCYDVFAALLFGAFVLILYKTCVNSKIKETSICIPILFVLLFCPEPTCYYDGIAYGINYLWSEALCLLFVMYFCKHHNNSYKTTICMALLSLIAGWSHEGFVIGICGGLFVHFITNYKRLSKVQWVMLVLFSIGAAFLVLAPGNFSRAGRLNESIDIMETSPLLLRLRFFEFVRSFYVLLLIFIVWFVKDRRLLVSFLSRNVFWLSSMAMSFLFLMVVGVLNRRAVVGFEFFSSILLCKAFLETDMARRKIKFVSLCSAIVIFLGGAFVLYYQVQTGEQYEAMERQASESKYKSCFVKVHDVNPNYFLKRFVCQYKFDEPWEPWEYEVLAWRYKKDRVIIAEGDWHTVDGNNEFKQLGNYLYSSSELPESVNLKFHLGEYQAYDFMSFMKKMASIVRPSTQDEIMVTLPVEKMEIENRQYYVVALYPNSSRKISAIDVE